MVVGVEFRRDHVNVAAFAEGMRTNFCKRIGQKSPDNLCSVQANHRVYRFVCVLSRQALPSSFGSHLLGLNPGQVDIIIDMGVVGCKVPGDHPDGQPTVFFGLDLNCSCLHDKPSLYYPAIGGKNDDEMETMAAARA